MSNYKIGNYFPKIGGKYLSANTSVVLSYNVKNIGGYPGPAVNAFPTSYYPNASGVYAVGYFVLIATRPLSISVNFGDGVIVNANFVASGPFYYFNISVDNGTTSYPGRIPSHVYTDGLTDHVVSFTINDPDAIIQLHTNLIRLYGVYPEQVALFRNLVTFSLGYPVGITSFPLSLTVNKSITTFSTTGSNFMGSRIPDEILSLPLTTLTISGSVNLSDPNVSNLKGLARLKDTLTSLSISSTQITTLPDEFMQLTKLTSLIIDTNRFKVPPVQLNALVNLQQLSLLGGYSSSTYLEEWGDLSNLVNLTTLQISTSFAPAGVLFTTTLPTWFNNLTKLKTFTISGVFWQNQTRCDTIVTNIYNLINANAAKTGSSTLPFRGMIISMYAAPYPQFDLRPSGTYQQPSGYVAGTSNGSPASPLEMIWVLVNQYAHTWTIKP